VVVVQLVLYCTGRMEGRERIRTWEKSRLARGNPGIVRSWSGSWTKPGRKRDSDLKASGTAFGDMAHIPGRDSTRGGKNKIIREISVGPGSEAAALAWA
jgi:hypothetical protein